MSAGDSSLVLGSRQAVISNDSVRCAGSTPGRTFPVVDGRNRWDRTKGLGRSCLPSRARSSRCPGFGPDGSRADLYSKRQPVAVRPSLPSRSAAPPTRLETRTKESNMYASHWVD